MRWFDFLRRRRPAPEPIPAGRLKIAGAMLTDVGRARAANEDSVVYFSGAQGDAFDLVAAVADGMGGHAAGEVASALALETLCRALKADRSAPPLALAAALREANAAIRQHAARNPGAEGMGTTCTAAMARGDRLWIGHVGDSRAYLLREGELSQLTEDHTLYAQLLREGAIAEGEGNAAAISNLLIRALGAAEEVEPMAPPVAVALRAGDVLMLCSDGLHGVVGDEAIAETLAIEEPGAACAALVEAANAAGGPDNVSVGVFRFLEPAAAGVSAPTRPQGLRAAME